MRSDVQKNLENLRAQKTIGSSLEGRVQIKAEGKTLETLQKFHGKGGISSDLREFFIVSDIEILLGSYEVKAEKASGQKCVRCWVYSGDIGKSAQHPEVCPKCIEALV